MVIHFRLRGPTSWGYNRDRWKLIVDFGFLAMPSSSMHFLNCVSTAAHPATECPCAAQHPNTADIIAIHGF